MQHASAARKKQNDVCIKLFFIYKEEKVCHPVMKVNGMAFLLCDYYFEKLPDYIILQSICRWRRREEPIRLKKQEVRLRLLLQFLRG